MSSSYLETELLIQMEAAGLSAPVREYKFLPRKRYRFDFCWPDRWLALEVDGGTRMKRGRHVRADGYESDCTKLNEAALAGWVVLRVTGDMVHDGRALDYARRLLEMPPL